MPDIATLGALLSSVKTATDIAKVIKNSDMTLAGAEAKLKMAELISALADVKLELAEVQDGLRDKDLLISSLKQELSDRKKLKYDGQFYLAEGDNVPFCAVCFEKDGKHHHLTHSQGGAYNLENYYCKVCDNSYAV